jgi:hypothetical protein
MMSSLLILHLWLGLFIGKVISDIGTVIFLYFFIKMFLNFFRYKGCNRGHGGLRKEIKVRTPYEALEYWYNLKPDLFIRKPDMFRSVVFESRE